MSQLSRLVIEIQKRMEGGDVAHSEGLSDEHRRRLPTMDEAERDQVLKQDGGRSRHARDRMLRVLEELQRGFLVEPWRGDVQYIARRILETLDKVQP